MGFGAYCSPGYADSVLEVFAASIVSPSNNHLFAPHPYTCSDPEEKYEEAYTLLRSFNRNLGSWIQFKDDRDVMKARDTLKTNCISLLRAYKNYFGTINESMIDYSQINKKMESWQTFKTICKDLNMDQNSDVAQYASSSALLKVVP